MNAPFRRSLRSRVMLRLGLTLAAFSLGVGLLILWLMRTASTEASLHDLQAVSSHYRQRIDQMLADFEDQMLRLKSRLEFSRLLADPGDQWQRLKGYLTTQNLLDTYERILITDASNNALFSAGTEELPQTIKHQEGETAYWYFHPRKDRLYRVYLQPVVLEKGRLGHLVLFRALDHGVVNRLSYPDTQLYLVHRGRVVASSLGEAGRNIRLRGDGIWEDGEGIWSQTTLGFAPADPEAPELVARRFGHSLFSPGALGAVLAATFAGLGVALWSAIGGWLVRVGRRLDTLDAATHLYGQEPQNSVGFSALIEQANPHGGDEIGQVASSLQNLAENLAVREAQRDAALQTLRESEAGIREITSTVADGIYGVDGDGRITFLNPEGERLLGWSEAELLGQDSHAAFHHRRDDGSPYPAADCRLHASILVGQPERLVSDWFVRRDGSLLPVSVSANPILDQGRVRGAVVAFTDISERLRSEAALKESEERFRLLFDNSNDGILVHEPGDHDQRGTFIEANEVICRRLGYRRDELLQLSPGDIEDPTLPPPQAAVEALERDGQCLFETQQMTRDGRRIPVEINARLVQIGGRRLLQSVVRDISERKQAEMEYRSIIATALDGFWINDLSGRLLEVNEAYSQMSGYSREELLSMRIPDLEAKESAEATGAHIEQLLATGRDRFETRHRRKDGSRMLIEVSARYLPIRNGVLVAFLRDITLQRRVEEHFRVLFNGSNDAIFVYRAGADGYDHPFIEVNSEACTRLGYSREQLLTLCPKDIDPPGDTNGTDPWERLEQTGQALFESLHLAQNGHSIPVEINAQRLEIDGQPIVLAVARDISARKEAERRVGELLALNQKIVTESTMGIAAYHADGPCVMTNEALARIVGGSQDEVRRQNFRRLRS